MTLVHDDQIAERWQPAVGALGELVDVRHDDVCLVAVGQVRIGVESRDERPLLRSDSAPTFR
jgi:hypothetical protein